MRIKDIRQFRSAWKNEQNYNMSGWDEHFVGSEKDNQSGFYKMINGIVNNIKADLTPKLQNAQDEQAIYEFLQNAADAEATHCAVIYDENYFLVLNNGKPFTEQDLKAILNSFQGTKADKSKAENCGKIGRYGIGFKLAYRLLGKNDGADELLNDYAGPLLFSWGSGEQFQSLCQFSENEKINTSHYAAPLHDAPWLLKIILTCFPTAPTEEVLNLERKNQVLFDANELLSLSAFLQKHNHLLNNLNLKQGSLFFIKFGARKHEKLKESLINLRSGIAYALNTLKTLKTVVLQDEQIEREEVILEKFTIEPRSEAFKRIEPEFPECPIDLWLGLPPSTEAALALKTAPSIYQFFPMRNERHNLAFFVHGTSFMKITDRTRLDEQGDANTHTFSYLAEAIKSNLAAYKRKDFKRFASIYKAILLSDAPDKHNHQLVGALLYKPLLEFARTGIPTNKGNTLNKDLVIIKKTQLAIEPMQLGIGKEWFFWDNLIENKPEQREAAQDNKLGLKKWGLKELIINAKTELLNEWISTFDSQEYDVFLAELKTATIDAAFMSKLVEIKCFQIIDNQGKTEFLTLANLLNEPNVFLISEDTKKIKNALQGIDFKVLEFKLDGLKDFAAFKQEQLAYLDKPLALFKKIATQIETISADSTRANPILNAHKVLLINFLKELKGVSLMQIREVRLFRNKKGECQPLSGLLSPKMLINPYFEPFRIHETDYSEELEPYLILNDASELYTQIVVNQFSSLMQDALRAPAQSEEPETDAPTKAQRVVQFLVELKALQKLKKGLPTLQNQPFVYVNDAVGFVSPQQVFWHNKMGEVSNYDLLEKGIFELTGLHVPAFELLPLLNEEPYKLQTVQSGTAFNKMYQDLLQNAAQNTLEANQKIAVFEALKPILDATRLERIPLFKNNLGENLSLKTLLNPEDSDKLLVDFCIHKEEFDIKLISHFAKKEETLENIIVPHLDKITSKILNHGFVIYKKYLDNTNLESPEEKTIELSSILEKVTYFYSFLKDFYKISTKKIQLNEKNIFFISEKVGFVSFKDLFYHQKVLIFENYEGLKKSFDDSFSLYLPHSITLNLIKENFFKLNDSQIQTLFKNEVIISEQNLLILFDWFALINIEPFLFLIVETTDKNKVLKINLRKDKIPAYVGKSKSRLYELVLEKAPEKFALMPEFLSKHIISKKGSLQEQEVFEYLMKFLDTNEAAEAALQSSDKSVQQHFYQKMTDVLVRSTEVYDANSFVVQALQAFRSKEIDVLTLKSKFVLENDNGELFRLSDYAFHHEMVIYSDFYGKIVLDLREIWPSFNQFKELADKLVTNFPESEQALLRKKVFQHPEPIQGKDLWNLLKESQTILPNAQALAFVLSYAQDNQVTSKALEGWCVYDVQHQAQKLSDNGVWLLRGHAFMPSNCVLHSDYQDFERIFKLNQHKPYWQLAGLKIVDELSVSRGYLRGYECILSSILTEEKGRLHILNQLTSTFETGLGSVQLDEEGTVFLENLLGCVLHDCLYPHEFALKEERLSDFCIKWLNASDTDYKLSMLAALGLHTQQSDLWHLRNYLKNGGEPIRIKQINDLNADHQVFITRTLQWCKQNKMIFSNLDERLSWLKRLYTALSSFAPHTPIPIISEIEDSEFFYQLIDVELDKVYYFNEARQNQLLDRCAVSMEEVLLATQKAGLYMTNLDLRNIQPRASKIEEYADLNYLAVNSIEWTTDFYLTWKEQFGFEIRLVDGEIPHTLIFMDTEIKRFKKGNSLIDNKIIYLNAKSANLEEELFGLSSSHLLTQQHLLALLRLKNNRREQAKDSHQTNADNAFAAAFNQIKRAKAVLKEFLIAQDYAFSEQLLESQGSLIKGLNKDNQTAQLVFKANTDKFLEFTEQELGLLQRGEAELVVFDGKNVQQVDFAKFLQARPRLHLELDLSALDSEDKEKLFDLLNTLQSAKIRV